MRLDQGEDPRSGTPPHVLGSDQRKALAAGTVGLEFVPFVQTQTDQDRDRGPWAISQSEERLLLCQIRRWQPPYRPSRVFVSSTSSQLRLVEIL